VTRVLLWVQHLLGSGHVERTRWIAQALAQRGAHVVFVTGGMPLPSRMPAGATVVQLPPLRAADATFSRLVDEQGHAPDDAYLARRRQALIDAFDAAQPDVVVLETYPFGRRALRFELEPLLARVAAAQPRPRVVASVRDLLQRRDDVRDRAAWEVARRCVDEILVHGDPALARLEETFPPAADGSVPVTYTGYVRSPLAAAPAAGPRRGVIVAASGGPVGEAMLAAALEARALSALHDVPWRVLVAHAVCEARFAALETEGRRRGVVVERHRDDFASLLRTASVAVTQAGYNTALDVLLARTPSVLVPFEAEGETEQRMRAERLAALGRAEVIAERALSPAAIAAAVDRAAARGDLHGDMPPCPFAVDGAERAADRILALARREPAR
jgi:predicted glycosyltransferase